MYRSAVDGGTRFPVFDTARLLISFISNLLCLAAQEGELIPDENEPELIPPEHLLIENVVRDPRVKFFGIPKLGAYLVVRITYDSWLQPGGEAGPWGCSLVGFDH